MWSSRSLLCASLAALSFTTTTSAAIFDPHALQVPRHDEALSEISVRDGFADQVKWTDWTSGDGVSEGYDGDKVWYIKDAIKLYLERVPAEKRNGVFWAGGATTEDDFDYIDEFIESPTRLDGLGVKAEDIYPMSDFTNMNLDGVNKQGTWWRAINRMSKALAASASGDGIAYVYLKPVNCRTIFSPPSQNPMDNDPTAGGLATNGEIWYYAELPSLMRNMNIRQIVSFHKNGRKFQTKVEWDADTDAATYPRTKYADIAMDASPIILPAEAGRPPLKKRQIAAPPFANTTWTTHASSILESSSSSGETTLPSETQTLSPSVTPSSFATITGTPTSATSTVISSTEVPDLPAVTVVDGVPVISGGYITEPIPVTETETIDPSGTEATSSAHAIQTELDILYPVIDSFIEEPSEDKADDSDDTIVIILPLALGLLGQLTPDPSPKPCSSGNLITSLFNAVSCAVENLKKLQDEIEIGVIGGFTNMPAIAGPVGILKGLKDPLNNNKNDEDPEEDDEDDEEEDDDEEEEEEEESSTTEVSPTETCTATSTASDCHVVCPSATESVEEASCSTTCYATMTGCDITATTSTTWTGEEACPLPTDYTSEAEPAGPFRTAWWDYGISCGGNCGGFIDLPSSFPVDEISSTVVSSTATATDESTTVVSVSTPISSTPTPSSESTEVFSTLEITSETTDASSIVEESTIETTVTTTTSSTSSSPSGTTAFSSTATISSETATASSTILDSVSTFDSTTGTTTFSSSPATTTAPAPTGPFPCHHRGGPRIETPYCQCSTETEGQTFFATVPTTDFVCAGYSTFPEAVTPTAPTGPYPCHHRGGPRVEEPFCQCTTVTLGQTFYTTAPTTHFVCAAYSTFPGEIDPTPTQVSGEALRCDDAKDSCNWAAEQFDDDTVYTEPVARLAFEDINGWDWFWDGDRGCIVDYSCENYDDAMSGKEIKEAISYMKENNDVEHCGLSKLSNTCEVYVHFCMEANGDCYFTPNYEQE